MLMERASQHGPNLSGSAWNDDFHRSPLSVDEPTCELGSRSQTVFEASTHLISVSTNEIVHAVEHCRRQDAHQNRCSPRPTQFAGDQENGATSAEHPGVGRSIVLQHVKRRQLVGIATEALNHRLPGLALERGEHKDSAVIVPEKELEQVAAEPTDSVVQKQVGAFACGRPLNGRMSHVFEDL